MSYIFSVKIYVEADTTPTDLDIGLENGVFFWTMGDFEQVGASYVGAKGVLTRDGISSIQKSVNVKRMGDSANIDGLTLSIDNTAKFWVKFITAFGDNVSLHGSRVEIREHLDLDLTGSLIFKGTCDLPSFSKSTYKIPVRSLSGARDSQLGIDITDEYKQVTILGVTENVTSPSAIGKIVPISFGELDKASFLKTGGEEQILTIGNSDEIKSAFPIMVGGNNNVECAYNSAWSSSTDDLPYLINLGSTTDYLFIKVIGGEGANQIVRVSTISDNGTNLDLVFANDLYTALDTTSVLSFIKITAEYDADFWKSGGVKNADGDINADASVYAYGESFVELPSIAIDIDRNNTNKNSLIQNPPYYSSDPSKITGFKFVQTDNLETTQNKTWFDIPADWNYSSNWSCFVEAGAGNNGTIWASTLIGDTTNQAGTDSTTWDGKSARPSGVLSVPNLSKIFDVLVPRDIPEDFDDVYFIVNCEFNSIANCDVSMKVKTQKWYDSLETIYDQASGLHQNTDFNIRNFPLSYQDNGLDGVGYTDFWTQYFQELSSFHKQTGFKAFKLTASNPDELRQLYKVGLEFNINTISPVGGIQEVIFDLEIFSAGFIFVSNADTSKNVYTRFNGRLYNQDLVFANGWTTNNLINDPLGALAHTKWLQNFTNEDTAVVPTEGWGKAYPTGYDPLNKVADTNGSYRHQDLDQFGWYDVELSKQITERKDSSSKAIAKDICNKFFLSTWVDKDGLENVTQIVQKTSLAIAQTINQANMISWGERIEQDSRDIFCEPIVNYDFNVASKKFNESVAITQVGVALATESDQANAVKGLDYLSDGSRANLWQRARALYTYYGVINEAPKVLTDNTWISKKDDAYWYLRKWLRFQGVGIVDGVAKVVPKNYFSFVVAYEVAIGWDIGTRINVNVPNLTDNTDYEAMVYSITRNVSASPPSVAVKVILFDLDVTEEIEVQDSFDATLETWQDSTSTLETNIQDEV